MAKGKEINEDERLLMVMCMGKCVHKWVLGGDSLWAWFYCEKCLRTKIIKPPEGKD